MDIAPHLISLSYTDKADNELDDLQITLEDREGLWQGDWLPKHGDLLKVKILADNFRGYEREELDCGEFEVDELTLDTSFDGGDVVTIKGVPAVAKSSLMMERNTRAWADVHFAALAGDVVGPAGLDVLYKAPEIIFERIEQKQESDLEFLNRVAKEQGLRLCLKKKQAIIYSGQMADQLEPIELERKSLAFGRASFKRTLDDVYTQCVVGYTDADNSETTDKEFKPEIPPTTGKVLTLSQRIEDPAQAERVAKAELRAKNCKEMTANLDGMGDCRMLAGTVLKLSGWGHFDSDYVIREAAHSISRDGGYTVSLQLDKALDY